MSSQPSLKPETQPIRQRGDQLSDAYRKAQKNYVLFSGILASWEILGIRFNAEEKWGIVLKNQTAMPLIFSALLFYSGYKMTIEWLQCDDLRRKSGPAKFDFWIAHLIGSCSVLIAGYQHETNAPIGDSIESIIWGIGFACLFACFATVAIWHIVTWKRRTWKERLLGSFVAFDMSLGCGAVSIIWLKRYVGFTVVGIAIVVAVFAALRFSATFDRWWAEES